MLTIRLFGGASLEGPDGPLTGRAAQRKPLALLAILATDRARSISRDRLMLLLAPDLDTERARHLLRDTTYALRVALGQDAVLAVGDELRLDRSQVRCDLWEFEAALESGDLTGAVAHRTGPFLDGFHLRDSPEFDTWAAAERGRLEARHAEALEALADGAASRGDAAEAARWWGERLVLDPLSTRATFGIMRALEASGDVAGALRRAATHAALVLAELGGPPDPAVAAEADRLRRAARFPLVPDTADAPIALPVAGTIAPDAAPPPTTVPRQPGWLIALAALAAVVIAGLLLRSTEGSPPMPELDRRRVAVAPFRNATGDTSLDPVGHMAADWISQGLSQSGLVEVVPLSTVLGSSRLVESSAERFGDDTAPVRSIAGGAATGGRTTADSP
ncbi:hypothetical protein BH23GEM3_BH23GEM3_10380 [soil metagenome]